MLKTCFKILMIDRSNMHLKKKSHYFWAGVYKPALCSNKISFKLRIRVFQALISSIFLYNSELWSLSKAQNNKMDVFQRMFLRQIVRNRKISNNEIYKLCNIEPWSNEIKRRRLKWFGHLVRLPENVPAKQALAEARKPYQKISGGQPTTWLSTIKTDLSEMNYNLKEAFEIAYDIDIYTRVTLYTAGHLHTAVPHCSHSRAPIVHTVVPRENNEHGCVYLRCRAVCKLPGCVEGHPWYTQLVCHTMARIKSPSRLTAQAPSEGRNGRAWTTTPCGTYLLCAKLIP